MEYKKGKTMEKLESEGAQVLPGQISPGQRPL